MGENIIFLNTDSDAHTFTAGTPEIITGEFDTSVLMSGDSYVWTADSGGIIDYFCMLHPWMVGVMVIDSPVVISSPTNITLNSIPSSIPLYDSISVSGILTAIDGTPISGKPVWIEAESSSGLYNSVDTTTDSNGHFESVLSFQYDDDVGNWNVYAGFDGDNDFDISYSADYSLYVEAPAITTTSTVITL